MDELSVRRAAKLLQAGFGSLAVGDIAQARDHFKASAANLPTADAYTYWAWMEHQLGNTSLAIELCHKAIALDPDFGNPYNDIGSYLIALGELDGAVPWLQKAIAAKRYDPRHFPHLNLARVYLAKSMPRQALQHFHTALELRPGDPFILQAIEETMQKIN